MYSTRSSNKINKKKTGRKLFQRLLPIFMIIPLLMVTTLQMPQTANAFIISKAISASAKKIVKEVTKDAAVNEAARIIFDYQMAEVEKKMYEIPEGYEAVCFEHATNKCQKPAAVKKLTSQDKKLVGDKVGDILEQRVQMTPFKKFLDWFAPIFAVGLTVVAIQYIADEDFQSFINDIAMQTLYDLGFITNVIDPSLQTKIPTEMNEIIDQPNLTDSYISVNDKPKEPHTFPLTNLTEQEKNDLLVVTSATTFEPVKYSIGPLEQYLALYQYQSSPTLTMGLTRDWAGFITETVIDTNTKQILKTEEHQSTTSFVTNIQKTQTTHQIFKYPFINQNGLYQFEIIQKDINRKHVFVYRDISRQPKFNIQTSNSVSLHFYNFGTATYKANFKYNLYVPTMIPLPKIEELPQYTDPIESSPYKTDETKITMPSPKTQEFTTEDGKKLTPSPTTPGEFIDEEGNIVPDDDVIVSDPKVEPTPDGDIVYTPEPTPENPNPTPEPITPPNETELGNKLPIEFVLALLKLLKATLNFMKFQFLFFAGLGYIPEREVPFEMFQAFKTFKPFNFPIYASVQGFAAFTATFLIFRVIRRIF